MKPLDDSMSEKPIIPARRVCAVILAAACVAIVFLLSRHEAEVPLFARRSHNGAINAIVFVPESNTVFTAGDDGIIKQLEAKTLNEIRQVESVREAILCGNYHSSKKRLLFGCASGEILIVDLNEPMEVTRNRIAREAITALFLSTNITSIGTIDGDVFILNDKLGTSKQIHLHKGKSRCLRIDRDEKTVFSLGDDGFLVLYDVTDERITCKYRISGDQFEVASDGNHLIVAGPTNLVFKISDQKMLELVDEKPGHLASARGLCISEDSKLVATCGSEGTLMAWEFPFRKRITAIKTLPRTQLCSICFISNHRLLCGGLDGRIFWVEVP